MCLIDSSSNMDKLRIRYLAAGIILLALTLTGVAIDATLLRGPSSESGGQKIKQEIRTGQWDATTTASGITEFWIRTHSWKRTDIRELRVHWETPRTNYTLSPVLTHNPDTLSGTQFAIQVMRDENGSAPYLDDVEDYVRITVRPRTFVSKNESALGPVKITITAPGVYRDRIILRNVTTDPIVDRPLTTVTETTDESEDE